MKILKICVLVLATVLSGKSLSASDNVDLWIQAIADRMTIITLYMILPSYEETTDRIKQEEEKKQQEELTRKLAQESLIKECDDEIKKTQKRAAKKERSRKLQLENAKKQKEEALIRKQEKARENLMALEAAKEKQREDSKKRAAQAQLCIKPEPAEIQEENHKKKRSGKPKNRTKKMIGDMIDGLLEDDV